MLKPEAAANEPIPINSRSPLIAITAVQALWRRMNRKLTKPMTQDRTQLRCSLDLSIDATIFSIAFLRRCSVDYTSDVPGGSSFQLIPRPDMAVTFSMFGCLICDAVASPIAPFSVSFMLDGRQLQLFSRAGQGLRANKV